VENKCVNGEDCGYELELPIPSQYRKMLSPILDKTPAAEVIIENGTITIVIPKKGEFEKDLWRVSPI
jgi:hypothetical protein